MTARIVRAWRDLPAELRGAAVAVGAFDGVHRGHQAVIGQARAAAERLGAPLAVVSFDPHPRRWFQPGAAPFRLMSPDQMARALGDLGVQTLFLLPFDAEMAAMSHEAFAGEVLAGPQAAQGAVGRRDGLGIRHAAVGFDFTFGKGRTGSPEALRALGERLGFTVSTTDRIDDAGGLKLSSSAVREALHAGDMARAAAILGRPFAIEGEVIHGDKRGRTIGVPTANVPLGDYMRPAFGVYATRTRLDDGRTVDGVANLGLRPMWRLAEPLLEVWLFDFDGDLYGRTIETELVAFLRPEMSFDGLEPLKAQIDADAAAARRALANAPRG
ncbi:MAG: bifunctional riboflavin kinase/FAD synthetase [Alphaproteobacteria bacterium]|nr:bifunctional riboflavin kinase/FAD synthetase [Alphaproteobacteria bacterium]MBU1526805.1 bifunctional riboflavin kinase/FAD synthetase [Alphaproteobacteria bacterium]MBU2351640.1 bifunctional riboflavin kinase/FAD synthetase [Alphaproteobacteria bacterium]MBU2381309.1 bifunctional riboflavin kinase/FAD synthetase [Alphaproteobacteria bacterium]